MVDVTVRRAAAADAASVRDLVQKSYSHYVALIGRRPAPMDADYDEVLSSTDSWVVELDGDLVAVAVTRTAQDHVLLENIAVLPAVQGRGIGGRLLTVVENHARACQVGEVRLYTHELMTENLAFYARHGFRETGRAQQHGFHRVFLAKAVPAR